MNERPRVKIMKTNIKIKTILAVMAVSATALMASAQDNGQNGQPPGGGGGDQGGLPPGDGGGPGGGGGFRHHPPIPAIVRALDVNHDGIIDSNEIANASAELLTLDKNGDGQLTIDEYMGKRPGPPPDAPDENANTNSQPGGDQAGPPPGGGPPQDGGFGGHRPHRPLPPIVRALDVNHDGIIDSNEIANASAELLTLDKNHDGQLTRDEYMGKRPGPPRDGGGNGDDQGGPPPDGGNGMDGPPPADGNGPPPQQ
jgi:hypothetical protein